jgi:hypothetical protein
VLEKVHELRSADQLQRRRLERHGVGRAWLAVQQRQFSEDFARSEHVQDDLSPSAEVKASFTRPDSIRHRLSPGSPAAKIVWPLG